MWRKMAARRRRRTGPPHRAPHRAAAPGRRGAKAAATPPDDRANDRPPRRAAAPAAPDPTTGLVVVNAQPPNAESPAAALAYAVTPAAAVYLRTNFGVPDPAAVGGHLAVGGRVGRPLRVPWDELRALPQRTVVATMECAGNDRVAMRPLPEGEPWLGGAVSTVEWTGVPLAELLAWAGVAADAVEVLATGADAGPRGDAGTPAPVPFARSLPRADAAGGDALVALAMNGRPLTPAHGAPARLVVPAGTAWRA
jgi:DMSO/TMAO reductase YedYZ molybdopterin-dependent catalytic subunit